MVEAFQTAANTCGVGSGSAPLVTGHSEFHASAEREIAKWKGTESAVLVGSGYAANLAAVQMLSAVTNGRVRFLIDKLSHASLVDAVRGAQGIFRVFPHNNMHKLRRLLEQAEPGELQVVVTESIFSMDGDAADLPAIAKLKQEFPFLLLLDEAHGSGVYGVGGAGYAAEMGLGRAVDLTVVTLSKAIGCSGGALCGSKSLCDAIVNFSRPYIFSTAMPPAIPLAVQAAIEVMREEPWRQQRVRELALKFGRSDSPIIPIILGDESAALQASNRLMEAGMLVVAIRPPTVPVGTSRLHVTLSCDHTDAEVELLRSALNGELESAKTDQ